MFHLSALKSFSFVTQAFFYEGLMKADMCMSNKVSETSKSSSRLVSSVSSFGVTVSKACETSERRHRTISFWGSLRTWEKSEVQTFPHWNLELDCPCRDCRTDSRRDLGRSEVKQEVLLLGNRGYDAKDKRIRGRRHRKRERDRGAAAAELMVESLTSELRKADRGTCDTSVGLPEFMSESIFSASLLQASICGHTGDSNTSFSCTLCGSTEIGH